MYGPPDPRDRPAWNEPTWTGILVSYALMAAIPLSLWVASRPLLGGATLAGAAGLLVGARRAAGLARCLSECRQLTFALGENLEITVRRRREFCESS